MRKIVFAIISMYLVCLSNSVLADPEMDKFKKVFAQYNKKIEAGDVNAALPLAKQAFELGEAVFEPDSANLLALADNHAYILISLKRAAEAEQVYVSLLEDNEEIYGRYAEGLIPILEGLSRIVSKVKPNESKQHARRALQLKMRHNSMEMSQKIDEGKLKYPKHISKLKREAEKSTGAKFKIFEGEHWVIAYQEGYEEGLEIMNRQIELSYRSIRSFMLAINFSQRPLKEKLALVLFGTEEEYLEYVEGYRLSVRSRGSYFIKKNAIIIYDQVHRRSDWEYFKRTNLMAGEVFQQVGVKSGMFAKDKKFYPLWLWDGFAYAFEFNEIDKEFGPHTNNLSSRNWEIAQELIDDEEWPPLESFVRRTKQDEQGLENKELLKYYGTFLVRFLYTHYTDEFLTYLSDLPAERRNMTTARDRAAAFRKAFGDPVDLEKKWRKFIRSFGITFP